MEDPATSRQISCIKDLIEEINKRRPVGPLTVVLDGTRMTKKEASEIIDLLQFVLERGFKIGTDR